jgi:ribosomal protein S18 acetylase RimI-like enzyme
MIPVSLQTRPAKPADQQQIANLMFFEAHAHRHLDWRTPLEWLGSPNYWVLEDHGRINAALACPQDPPGVAWIRLFTFNSHLTGPEAWAPLWEAMRDEISQSNDALIAAIAIKPWFQTLLQNHGFEHHQSIVLLEWTVRTFEKPQPPNRVVIRPMQTADLPVVVETDADAFVPLWQNSFHALERAYSQAISATVAEQDGRVIGYQISTGAMLGGHLARLAVSKEAQGRGVGSALVHDLLHQLSLRNILRVTVNTQADNDSSLALYQKIGFVRTGEQYPVFIHQV